MGFKGFSRLLRFCKGLGALGFLLKGSIRITKGYYKGFGASGFVVSGGFVGLKGLGLRAFQALDFGLWAFLAGTSGLGFGDV